MTVRVRYLGPVSRVTGASLIEYDLPQPLSVAELLDQLAARHGEKFQDAMRTKTREGSMFYQVLINGRNMFAAEGLQSTVHPGDEVLISIPLSGG